MTDGSTRRVGTRGEASFTEVKPSKKQAEMSVMKVSVVLMILSLVQVEASPGLMERLLASHLKKATCQARCAAVRSQEVETCLEICGLPESSLARICQHQRFCTGGCRAACTSHTQETSLGLTVSQEETSLGLTVSQENCLLTWSIQSLQSSQHSSVVFLVAGTDQAGMVSLLADLVLDTSLELSPALTYKYRELTVLAVDRSGLTDTKTITLQSVSHCQNTLTDTLTEESLPAQEEDQVSVEKIENKSDEAAVYLAAVVSLLILTTIAVSAILYRILRKDRKNIPNSAFHISHEDFLYDDQHNTEKYTFF